MKMTKAQREVFVGMVSFDSVTYSPKTQEYIVKHGYFYSHGFTEEKLAEHVTAAAKHMGMAITITLTSNHWNAWPRDSWFEVRFRVQNENGDGFEVPKQVGPQNYQSNDYGKQAAEFNRQHGTEHLK